jgi:cysteine synthase A
LQVQDELGPESKVVTVFPDDNKKYLSGDLLLEESLHPAYLTSHVDLVGLSAIGPTCALCEPSGF